MYKLSILTKMLHMTFSDSHSCGKSVHKLYKGQKSFKFAYINYAAIYMYSYSLTLIHFLKYF